MAAGAKPATEPGREQDLARLPLLAGLSAQVLRDVAAHLQVWQVERGDWVLEKGERSDHLLFLLEGRLQVVDMTEDGRYVGLNLLSPGDYFGELSMIDGRPRSASVLAMERSRVASIARNTALAVIYNNAQVVERLTRKMADSLRKASDYRSILSIPNAFQRVYAFLHRMTVVAPGGLTVIERMPTQQEVAIMVNTSRETVSRAVQALMERGVVEKDLRRLIVRQPAALAEAATRPDFG